MWLIKVTIWKERITQVEIYNRHGTAPVLAPRKKTSLGESLAKSYAYNPIRDSGETLGEREKTR